MSFELHHRLTEDCFEIGDLPLCTALLMNDQRFPWCILVPRRAGLSELHDLHETERGVLFTEIELASRALQGLYPIDKLNVAALGNQVPQLHIHVIGRSVSDAAWPAPVWGSGDPVPYPAHAAPLDKLRASFNL